MIYKIRFFVNSFFSQISECLLCTGYDLGTKGDNIKQNKVSDLVDLKFLAVGDNQMHTHTQCVWNSCGVMYSQNLRRLERESYISWKDVYLVFPVSQGSLFLLPDV